MDMQKVLLALLMLGAMVTLSNAQMQCGAGKCGAAMKSSDSVKLSDKPKKMMKLYQSVPKEKAILLQKGDAKAFCPECGMNLPMFYKTNYAATVEGKVKQYCSLHCVVADIAKGSKLEDIKVVDNTSLKFIDASKAYFVVGSSKKGTMTMVSKYAFVSKVDAERFAKENGGEVLNFATTLKRAKANEAKESAMVAKKQAMMAKKGAMLYSKMCQKTDEKFATVADAKAFITSQKLCKDLNGKKLQAVGLYLKNR